MEGGRAKSVFQESISFINNIRDSYLDIEFTVVVVLMCSYSGILQGCILQSCSCCTLVVLLTKSSISEAVLYITAA